MSFSAAPTESFDVIVVGGGHAGCEAAITAARLGLNTALFSLNLDRIAWQPCNPAVGGPAKSQLVHEVDALGGVIGRLADATAIQKRILNASRGPAVWALRAQTDKRLYVSPFMGMEMDYVFRGRPPAETLPLAIDGRDAQGLLIATAMTGRRRPLTDRALVAAALSMPLLTLKVVAAIHWEALKLWLKRTPLTRKPAPEPGVLVL